jgi:glyoxylase-like metal-dependent hydrolase (beta-lactamase superfamily II)
MADQWRVGSVRITRVVETEITFPIELIPEAAPDAIASASWIPPDAWSRDMGLNLFIQAFVLESSGARLLIDPCVGNGRRRSLAALSMLQTRFIDRLRESGFPPESIDIVICTHMHFDHLGWNTTSTNGQWVPTFPNARYLFNRREWDYTMAELAQIRPEDPPADYTSTFTLTPELRRAYFADIFSDSVQPVLDAGLVDLIQPDHAPTPELSVLSTPGHTPGHVSLQIDSNGSTGVVTGDAFHHEIQVAYPTWSSRMDLDGEEAARSRSRILSVCAGQDGILLGTHFRGITAGRVLSHGDTLKLDPVRS